MDEENVVKEAEAVTEVVTDETEQTAEQAEASSQPVDGKDYKAIAEQLSKDIKEKNRKIQELKSQKTVEVEAPAEDETVRRFVDTEKRSMRAEANTEIIMMLQSDPTFKDRVDIVKDYVEKGYDIKMADKLAKSDIMDKILTALPEEAKKSNQPKQIETQAIPEKKEFQESGNHLKDFLDDPNVPDSAKEAARRYF